jgi:hypothetical protein
MNLRLDIEGTFEEYLAVNLIYNREQRRKSWLLKIFWSIYAVLVVLFLALAACLSWYERKHRGDMGPPEDMSGVWRLVWIAVAYLAVAGVLYLLVLRLALPRYLKRVWVKSPDARLPRVLLITDEGVTETTELSNATYRWGGFIRWLETDEFFLLNPNPVSVVIIPKRVLATAADVEALRQFLAAHITSSP